MLTLKVDHDKGLALLQDGGALGKDALEALAGPAPRLVDQHEHGLALAGGGGLGGLQVVRPGNGIW